MNGKLNMSPTFFELTFWVLTVKMTDGSWFPVLNEGDKTPTSIWITISTNSEGKCGGLTKAEWIERYKRENSTDNEFRFELIGSRTF